MEVFGSPILKCKLSSSGSSARVGGGGVTKKHEIYVAARGSKLFMTYTGPGGGGSATVIPHYRHSLSLISDIYVTVTVDLFAPVTCC